jgi:integrase
MFKWAIVVQVYQISIGMSGQAFTTSEPKCTGALFGRLFKRTKNSESRTIPINPAMHELCARLLEDEREPRNAKRRGKRYLLKLTECREALANACAKAGVSKVGHHALRHLFTTRAIEAQIPIPTVARWLGHKDGGALLMRTYSHLLDAHSKAMAQRMTF